MASIEACFQTTPLTVEAPVGKPIIPGTGPGTTTAHSRPATITHSSPAAGLVPTITCMQVVLCTPIGEHSTSQHAGPTLYSPINRRALHKPACRYYSVLQSESTPQASMQVLLCTPQSIGEHSTSQHAGPTLHSPINRRALHKPACRHDYLTLVSTAY